MTRVQRERFTDLEEYERVKNVYILRNDMLRNSRENLRILHPLPRVNEIAYDVDDNPKAYYIQQARNGLFARQAIICEVLGISIDDKNEVLCQQKEKRVAGSRFRERYRHRPYSSQPIIQGSLFTGTGENEQYDHDRQ